MHGWNRYIAAVVATLALASAAHAQDQGEAERIARIVAIVGDSIITNWDIQERLLQLEAQTRQPLPPQDSPEFERLASAQLEDAVNDLLLIQAAARDTSLVVDEGRLTEVVNSHIETIRQQVGGEAAFQSALAQSGMTMTEYRDRLTAQQRRNGLVELYQRKIMQTRKPPPIPEEQLRTFYENNPAQFGTRPPLITFDQIFVRVEPSDSALAAAMAKADSLYQRIQEGDSFEALARQYSEDPASKEKGGELGWYRRGQLVSEFEDAAFSPLLRIGSVTRPVKTEYGVHLIRVDRVRGAERMIHHILIRPKITDADLERARQRAQDVLRRLEAGERATELAATFGAPDAQVRVGPIRRDSLPLPYTLLPESDRAKLTQAQDGEVVGPLLFDDAATQRLLVARIVDTEDARPATYEDSRDLIRQRLQTELLMREVLTELRRSTRVELRLDDRDGG